MGIFRRRPAEATKESVLAEARRATKSLRRRNGKAKRNRARGQANPTYEVTGGPWLDDAS